MYTLSDFLCLQTLVFFFELQTSESGILGMCTAAGNANTPLLKYLMQYGADPALSLPVRMQNRTVMTKFFFESICHSDKSMVNIFHVSLLHADSVFSVDRRDTADEAERELSASGSAIGTLVCTFDSQPTQCLR
jgi:hypothetical protein